MMFDLDDDVAYQQWQDAKGLGYPQSLADLVVEIRDPFALTAGEKGAILSRCAKANMALYRVVKPETITRNPLLALMAQLGVRELDRNLGAGADGLSALTPGGSAHQPFADFIPYRAAAIGWHTDGYYHPADRQIHTLALYCQRPAREGGENDLVDHDRVYMQLRDESPDYVRTLMEADIMAIPPRLEAGKVARPESLGPVFSLFQGHLHMRYTARTVSIRWRDDPAARAAVVALKQAIKTTPFKFRGRLETGWGLISNNVLHTRAAFRDVPGEEARILYRGRFFDRLPIAV